MGRISLSFAGGTFINVICVLREKEQKPAAPHRRATEASAGSIAQDRGQGREVCGTGRAELAKPSVLSVGPDHIRGEHQLALLETGFVGASVIRVIVL